MCRAQGVISYLAGTAGGSPSAPGCANRWAKLAEITVTAGATTITSAMITDRRKNPVERAFFPLTLLNGTTEYIQIRKDPSGIVMIRVNVVIGTGANDDVLAQLPRGIVREKFVLFTAAIHHREDSFLYIWKPTERSDLQRR